MVGIAVMVEITSAATVIIYATNGQKYLWIAQALGYGFGGFLTWVGVRRFLGQRGVTDHEIWHWPRANALENAWASHGLALGLGAVLGIAGLGYLTLLHHLPFTQEIAWEMDEHFPKDKNSLAFLFIMAVGMAPLAEEYLFRGLLFRALDREWGGPRALFWSASFFAIYHPPVSWIPVFAVGLAACWLFRKTGRLGPCVLLHMVYNALVLALR
jgi:membrane protease YdiL (CAAX protease family)